MMLKQMDAHACTCAGGRVNAGQQPQQQSVVMLVGVRMLAAMQHFWQGECCACKQPGPGFLKGLERAAGMSGPMWQQQLGHQQQQ
jgi:hypothetical protein